MSALVVFFVRIFPHSERYWISKYRNFLRKMTFVKKKWFPLARKSRKSFSFRKTSFFSAAIYLLKVDNGNTRTIHEICSKLPIRTPDCRHWRLCGAIIANFNIFHILFSLFQCRLWTSKCQLGCDFIIHFNILNPLI